MGVSQGPRAGTMVDRAALAAYGESALWDATVPGLPNHYRGKVRDNYDLPDGRRVIVASDRLSAFDRIITALPFKGQVLTQTARYWFDATRGICPNHVLAYPDLNVVVGRTLRIMPVEIVVRDYLAGSTGTSILSMYKAGKRELYGLRFAEGLRDNQKLPATIITPTTKAAMGGHDEPLTPAEILARKLLTRAQWGEVSRLALALFAFGREQAAKRGLILADTKYEFGFDAEGRIQLADEIHTPDSSRYWMAASYPRRFAAGEGPQSFDKDFVRNWVAKRCDPYKDAIPEIPREVVLDAAAVYIDAYEMITGERFVLPAERAPPIERIRRNVARYLERAPA